MTTVLIPCAGDSTRWGRPYPKQLAYLNGESIIDRIIRQCLEQGNTPLVITRDPEITSHIESQGAQAVYPTANRWLVETLISTRNCWDGEVIILLGDVIFHPRLFKWLWNDSRPLQLYGTPHEIYALSFDVGAVGIISRALHVALDYAQAHPKDGGGGKLWSVYKALVNWPQANEIDYYHKYFTFVKDEYTTDIDSIEQYEAFLQNVVKPGLLDEVKA